MSRISGHTSPLLCAAAILISGCSSGPAFMPVSTAGSTTGASAGTTPPVSAPNLTSITQPGVYLPDFTHDQPVIQVFPKTQTGIVSPTTSIAGTMPSVDGTGHIYIYTGESIAVYDPASPIVPLRTLPTGTGTSIPAVIDVMASQAGEIYVYDGSGIAVFSSTANGADKPVRYIIPPPANTPYGYVTFTLDTLGNLYLLNQAASISVFDASANGPVQPIRVIQGPLTHLDGNSRFPSLVTSLATDKAGNLYAASVWYEGETGGGFGIFEFPANASGNVAPAAYFSDPRMYPWSYGNAIAVDGAGTIYLSSGTDKGQLMVFEFAPNTANSNTATSTVTIPGWTDSEPSRMAVNF